MKLEHFFRFVLVTTLCILTPTLCFGAETPSPMTGWLTIVWGDSNPQLDIEHHRKIHLTDDTGTTTELTMSDELLAGGVFRWNGRRVKVFPVGQVDRPSTEAIPVAALRLLDDPSLQDEEFLGGVSGSQPWVSILCKFADLADEPEDLAFFQGMYANVPGGLDHYWREVSADTIDVVGSIAIDWVTLPGIHTSYVPTPGSGTTANLNGLFDDCTAAADPFVDFANGGSPFAGINMMFNGLLDCCAWGGSRFDTLDGVQKSWRTTWEPPWGYADEAVIAHEMGHGFGLPHTNNWDLDSNPYDNPWDVMSAANSYAAVDSTYGRLGKHINAYHKDQLGWFAPARRFEPAPNSSTTISLDHTALAGSTNYQMVRIPIPGTDWWYTVEARLRSGDYDASIPGDSVIIHQVRPGRSEPAWAVDADLPPADFSDNEGTMWRVGETFSEGSYNIHVSVDAQTASGFEVTITTGVVGVLFGDGFESGDTSSWSP